ncbi:hypothetical protein JB92DRAFT_2833180 [Gautieria morchelliformis]|nr:hypothetical protein JB92DRAFT_2833180 [Gautieria morchelliformis]
MITFAVSFISAPASPLPWRSVVRDGAKFLWIGSKDATKVLLHLRTKVEVKPLFLEYSASSGEAVVPHLPSIDPSSCSPSWHIWNYAVETTRNNALNMNIALDTRSRAIILVPIDDMDDVDEAA